LFFEVFILIERVCIYNNNTVSFKEFQSFNFASISLKKKENRNNHELNKTCGFLKTRLVVKIL